MVFTFKPSTCATALVPKSAVVARDGAIVMDLSCMCDIARHRVTVHREPPAFCGRSALFVLIMMQGVVSPRVCRARAADVALFIGGQQRAMA